jgi:hypothetical protein
MTSKHHLRTPIPEIAEAAQILKEAVAAHLASDTQKAADFIRLADMPIIREYTESIWGANSPYVIVDKSVLQKSLPKDQRIPVRMPNTAEKKKLHERDGYHCRFCGIPVIRAEIRAKIHKHYPLWGRKNSEQHAAFQCMWAQYDHVLPHAKGGNNDFENVVVTCAPCNFGRMDYTLEEVGLSDPRLREPVQSSWDGLERFK